MDIYEPLNNKYTKWYNSIICKAKERNWNKNISETYGETHHIIPRSLGGSNDESNLVFLTAKEHFICHILLKNMFEGKQRNKMVVALFLMSSQNNRNYKLNSKTYQKIKEEFLHYQKTKTVSPEVRKQISEKLKGKIFSEETKKKISESKMGLEKTQETRNKISQTLKGNIPWNKGLKTGAQSEEVKKRTSEAVKKWWKLRKENAINTNMQSKEN